MNGHFNKRGRNNNHQHQRRRQGGGGGGNPNRALDSNGPEVRIRGTAQQIYDKYLALARDATSSGDRVRTENYLQHAEHYFRVLRAVQGPQVQSSVDQHGDGDHDDDQPAIGEHRGEQRDFRDQGQPPTPSFDAGEAEPTVVSGEGQPAADDGANGAGAEHNREPRGQDQGRGDAEGRRRRRRPRRHREEGGGDNAGGDNAGAEEDAPEPVGAE